MFSNGKYKSCICVYIHSQPHPLSLHFPGLPPAALLLLLSLSTLRLKALRFSGR